MIKVYLSHAKSPSGNHSLKVPPLARTKNLQVCPRPVAVRSARGMLQYLALCRHSLMQYWSGHHVERFNGRILHSIRHWSFDVSPSLPSLLACYLKATVYAATDSMRKSTAQKLTMYDGLASCEEAKLFQSNLTGSLEHANAPSAADCP